MSACAEAAFPNFEFVRRLRDAIGDDGTVLYVTADMHLVRVRTSTKGNRF